MNPIIVSALSFSSLSTRKATTAIALVTSVAAGLLTGCAGDGTADEEPGTEELGESSSALARGAAEEYPEKAECETAIGYIESNSVACAEEVDAITRPNVSCESRAKAQYVFSKFASCRKTVTGS